MSNELTDVHGRELRVGDVVFYGVGFYTPILGLVVKINKSGWARLAYIYSKNGNNENIVRETWAKRAHYSVRVNELQHTDFFRGKLLDISNHAGVAINDDKQQKKVEEESIEKWD